MNNRSNK